MAYLNTSDHLPLISTCQVGGTANVNVNHLLDWDQAVTTLTGELSARIQKTGCQTSIRDPSKFMPGLHGGGIGSHISYLSRILKKAAKSPSRRSLKKKGRKYKDDKLCVLCEQSRAGRQAWKENGYPREGPLF